MFGIKTKTKKICRRYFVKLTEGKLSSDVAIRQLMEYFKVDEYGHQADTKKADLGYGWIHYCLIRAVKPRRVLCIGSRYGFIPAVSAQACKDQNKGYVDFVDPGYGFGDRDHWTGAGYWRTKEGKECFRKCGLENRIALHLMTSKEFAKKFSKYKYDFIYIDGDHSYKGVKLDYKLFWPRLNSNGFMAFHDICVKESKPEGAYGVHKLWEEIKEKHSFLIPFEGSGLGVIQKAND